MRKKNQWRICDIYSGKSKNFSIRTKRSFWRRDSRFGGLLKGGLTVLISVLVIYTIVQAGSLTPSASPGSTMHSLQELWDILAGTNDASSVSPNASGNIQEQLEFIMQNLGGYTYGSSDANQVLTTANGTYDATNLIPENVRSGVVFGIDNGSQVGTYGGGGWTYGSDQAEEVLTIADAAGTYDATNLASSTVKFGVTFGVNKTGAYPSATYPLPNASGTITDLAGNGTSITSSNGSVEWWQSDGTRQTATLDFPELSNVCSTDTSNNSAGTLTIDATKVLSGTTYCGTAGTFDPWTPQKNVRWDDWRYSAGTTGSPFDEYTGEEATWIQTDPGGDTPKCVTDNAVEVCLNSNEVWQDTRTGLYWSDRTAVSVDNEFRYDATGQCNFTDTGTANAYCDNQDPDNVYTEDDDVSANDFCLNLQLDADNDGTLETDWRLPSQKELLQAYIDGSANNLPNVGFTFWSATENSSLAAYAWRVYLNNGYTYNTTSKGLNYYARCVRP